MLYAVYNPATGAVLRSGQCQESDLELQAGPGEAVIERSDPYHHDGNAYVDLSRPDPVIVERPATPATPATLDGTTITGIPEGAVLTIEDVDYIVNDGTAELSFTLPGTYRVKLSLWPYLDAIFEVTKT